MIFLPTSQIPLSRYCGSTYETNTNCSELAPLTVSLGTPSIIKLGSDTPYDQVIVFPINFSDTVSYSYDSVNAYKQLIYPSAPALPAKSIFINPNDEKDVYVIFMEESAKLSIVQLSLTANGYLGGSSVLRTVTIDTTAVEAAAMSNDGLHIVTINSSHTVRHYTMSSPFDLDTLALQQSGTLPSSGVATYDLYIKDGTSFFVSEWDSGAKMREYSLSSSYDLSTLASTSNFNTTFGDAIDFKSDGTKFYVQSSANITQYTLSTPWDLTSAGSSVSPELRYVETLNGIRVSPTGTYILADWHIQLYFGDYYYIQLESIYLNTPYDLSGGAIDYIPTASLRLEVTDNDGSNLRYNPLYPIEAGFFTGLDWVGNLPLGQSYTYEELFTNEVSDQGTTFYLFIWDTLEIDYLYNYIFSASPVQHYYSTDNSNIVYDPSSAIFRLIRVADGSTVPAFSFEYNDTIYVNSCSY